MHATLILLTWLSLLVSLQLLAGPALLCAWLVVMGLGLGVARIRLLHLFRRVWVLIAVVAIIGAMTPGEALWYHPWLPAPSYQGLSNAATQAARILLAVAMVALLLAKLPRPRLLAALWGLLQPLVPLRMSPQRFIVRLMLVLEALETMPSLRQRKLDWRAWLESDQDVALPRVQIRVEAWQRRDVWGWMMLISCWGVALWMWP
jgi:energy-coupling factor transporter transmembrane protein EcfT